MVQRSLPTQQKVRIKISPSSQHLETGNGEVSEGGFSAGGETIGVSKVGFGSKVAFLLGGST